MVNHPFTGPDMQAVKDWLADPEGGDWLRVPTQPAESPFTASEVEPGVPPEALEWGSVVLHRAVKVRPAPHTNDTLTGYQAHVAMAGPDVIAEGDYFLVTTNMPRGEWNRV